MVSFDTGTFIVDSSGEIEADFLYDGGWFRGEVAVFSLNGMETLEPGSTEFMLEAARRALTNSSQGHILIQDQIEGARFSEDLPWERSFNSDPINNPGAYLGVKTFNMTPGDEVALMIVQHNTVQDTWRNPDRIYEFGKLPLFSIPEANFVDTAPGQFEFVNINNTGAIASEDVPISRADKDYNDIVFQLLGLNGNLAKYEDHINPSRDWLSTSLGQQIDDYTKSRVFSEGVFKVGDTGEITIDFLYDGGLYDGEVGIFSLEGLKRKDIGTDAFIEEVINRAQSNSPQGYVVVKDAEEGARFSSALDWEANFNTGNYQGRKTFQMNPGELFGMVLIPNGTLAEGLTAHESVLSLAPIFSMAEANYNNQVQFADVLTGAKGTIVSFEDEHIDRPSNEDFNDIVFAIEGIQEPIGVSAIEDVIFPSHNWLGTEVGELDILNYFDNLDPI